MLKTSLIIFFVLLAVGLSFLIAVSSSLYPLFDFAVQDLDWTNQWLMMSVADYYGAATCLCAIAVASESWPMALLWCAGFYTLGSPICCLYCAQRLYFGGSLALRPDEVYRDRENCAYYVSLAHNYQISVGITMRDFQY